MHLTAMPRLTKKSFLCQIPIVIFVYVWCIYICTAGPPDTLTNVRVSNITDASFVVQWDALDDADQYFVNWRNGNGSVREAVTLRTSHIITGLTSNTIYRVTVTAFNGCGIGLNSNIYITTTYILSDIIKLLSTSTMILPTTSSAMQPSSTCSPIQLIREQSGNV